LSKNEIRQTYLQARRAMPRELIVEKSRRVEENLVAQKEYLEAKSVAGYVAREDEVQTVPILERVIAGGKKMVVPRVDPVSDQLQFFEIRGTRELAPGRFGILEPKGTGAPVPLDETDIVLVPLIAWDGRGYRVGYGKGYFDRALSTRGSSAAIGLAFESQAVPRVPDSGSDVPLNLVVTENRVVRFGKAPG